jgi:hypothetical protein
MRQPLNPSGYYLLARLFLAQLIFSTLKMEAIYSSETSVDTQRTTWRYIPEDGTLQVVHGFHSERPNFQ